MLEPSDYITRRGYIVKGEVNHENVFEDETKWEPVRSQTDR